MMDISQYWYLLFLLAPLLLLGRKGKGNTPPLSGTDLSKKIREQKKIADQESSDAARDEEHRIKDMYG
jgi:hypothetical protein